MAPNFSFAQCAILAEAGPQRQRLLATLYKDERSAKAENYLVLEKMYLERIITKREVEAFAKNLQAHQLALLGDGSTVLVGRTSALLVSQPPAA